MAGDMAQIVSERYANRTRDRGREQNYDGDSVINRRDMRRKRDRDRERYRSKSFNRNMSEPRENLIKKDRKFSSPSKANHQKVIDHNTFDSQKTQAVKTGGFDSFSPPPMDSMLLADSEAARSFQLVQIAQQLGLTAEGAKAARELYIGNLPPGVDVNQLVEFLNAALMALRLNILPGPPVLKSWISTDGHFAFVEFRTMEEASSGMQLNGLNCLGYNLRVGRPKTYPNELAAITAHMDTQIQLRVGQCRSNLGLYSDNVQSYISIKWILHPIPAILTEEKTHELLSTFGALYTFEYIDYANEMSGRLTQEAFDTSNIMCVFEYEESDSMDVARRFLKGLKVGNTVVCLIDANRALDDDLISCRTTTFMRALGGDLMQVQVPTRVLMLSNLANCDELKDNIEYEEIIKDVKDECLKFGKVLNIAVPRPEGRLQNIAMGYGFVLFESIAAAGKTKRALSGRQFGSRTVEVSYFSEKRFEKHDFSNPTPNYYLNERL